MRESVLSLPLSLRGFEIFKTISGVFETSPVADEVDVSVRFKRSPGLSWSPSEYEVLT